MAENKRDLYEVLEIGRDATPAEIKKAYQKRAKQVHPDFNPDDPDAEEKMKEVNAAYEILSNEEAKMRYDRYGFEGIDPSYSDMGGGGYGFGGGLGDFYSDILSDLLGGFGGIGGRRSNAAGRQRAAKGESLRSKITITFEEAAFGCEKEINIIRSESCEVCDGTGSKSGTSKETCSKCGGLGQVEVRRQAGNIVFSQQVECNECGGAGVIIKNPCEKCNGSGKIKKNRKLKFRIKPGIEDESNVILRGQGNAGYNGGPAGDIQVRVKVEPHEYFVRDGKDIMLDMPLSFIDAAIGADIVVPTIEGKVKYKISEGTQTGTIFRLKGSGIQGEAGERKGDQYVKLIVETPTNLNAEQKKLLKKFGDSLTEQNHAKKKGFFGKVKEAFSAKP